MEVNLIVSMEGKVSNSQGRNGHKGMLSQPLLLLWDWYRRRFFANIHGSDFSDFLDPMNLQPSNIMLLRIRDQLT
jgi:hypothetical protein